jgi:hypothetical protein
VSPRAFSNTLDTFVVECSTRGFPAKLYVVVPEAKGDPDFASNLKKAKSRGVGVIEVPEAGSPYVFSDAVPLSLFGLRRPDITKFPAKKREAVKVAEATFLNGNPVQGCQALYAEIEAVTRAFAERSKAEGWWRSPHSGEAGPSVDLKIGPWAIVLDELARFLDLKNCKKICPKMTPAMLAGARSLTDPRNLTSHKPQSVAAITDRDAKLRTWFEGAADLLRNWFEAVSPLKL